MTIARLGPDQNELAAAVNKSFDSFESLGEALKQAGPVADDANMNLEESLAILGKFDNVGIHGSGASGGWEECDMSRLSLS